VSLLTGLFGGEDNQIITILIALGLVLVLIVLGVWALKLVMRASNSVGRGRNRRLAVIDSAAVDPKRQLVLIRRDNVEHLIMTGGTHDLVIENGIEPPAESIKPARQKRTLPGIGAIAGRNGQSSDDVPPVTEPKAPKTAIAKSEVNVVPDEVRSPEDAAPKRPSLRYTGLLRSGNRVEPPLTAKPSGEVANNPESQPADSDTTGSKAESAKGGGESGDHKKTSTKAG